MHPQPLIENLGLFMSIFVLRKAAQIRFILAGGPSILRSPTYTQIMTHSVLRPYVDGQFSMSSKPHFSMAPPLPQPPEPGQFEPSLDAPAERGLDIRLLNVGACGQSLLNVGLHGPE